MTPEQLAKGQLEAYNKKDVEEFISFYSDDVEVYNFPLELVYKGKDEMRKRYTKTFSDNPNQYAKLVNRMTLFNKAIDQEHVTGRADGVDVEVIAIYEIKDDKIAKVIFVRT